MKNRTVRRPRGRPAVLAASVALALGGCVVGPDFHPPEAPKVAANDVNASAEKVTSPPAKLTGPDVREQKPATDTEVAAARPVSPEVRRAEPAPPAEGPEQVAPTTTEKKVVTTAPKPKKERAKKPKRDLDEEAIPRAVPVDDDEESIAETRPQPQLPGEHGRTRARFIGVTADGNWMFSLPSKKIVIVPPPPGG